MKSHNRYNLPGIHINIIDHNKLIDEYWKSMKINAQESYEYRFSLIVINISSFISITAKENNVQCHNVTM